MMRELLQRHCDESRTVGESSLDLFCPLILVLVQKGRRVISETVALAQGFTVKGVQDSLVDERYPSFAEYRSRLKVEDRAVLWLRRVLTLLGSHRFAEVLGSRRHRVRQDLIVCR